MGDVSKLAGHAFICYAREDSRRVDQLQRKLEAAGIPVWRDTANIWPGQTWRAIIRQAINNDAVVFIACFSSSSVTRARSYQNEELTEAIDQLRLRRSDDPWLIPVRFDECDIPDRDIGGGRTLASIHRADLFGPAAREDTARLIATIATKLEGAADQQAPTNRSRLPGIFSSWPWRRRRPVVPVTAIALTVAGAALTALLAADAGAVRLPGIALASRSAWKPTEITGVLFSGHAHHYTVTITGRGFGLPTVSLPYHGLMPNFRLANDSGPSASDAAELADTFRFTYQTWTATKIIITDVKAKPGDAVIIEIWNNKTRNGASWGGNVHPIHATTPVIKTVAFSGTTADPAITIHGTGFGPAPAHLPYTGNLDNLTVIDWRTDPNSYGAPGTWSTGSLEGPGVNERIGSWTNNTIQISGFSGTFGHGSEVFRPHDPITIQIWTTDKFRADPQTAWGGQFPAAGLRSVGRPRAHARSSSAVPSIYVTNPSENSVSVFRVGATTAPRWIRVPDPGPIVVAPDGKTAYVGREPGAPHGQKTVTPINIVTGQAEQPIALPDNSNSNIIDITPDGKTAYVASTFFGTVTPVNLATKKAGHAIKVASSLNTIAMTPDGKTVYVLSDDGGPGIITPVSTATNTAGPAIPVDAYPFAIAITPNSATAYVTSGKTVTPVNTATNVAGPAIPLAGNVGTIAITPDGRTAYVTAAIGKDSSLTAPGTVIPINLTDNKPGRAIKVGADPNQIVIAPDGKTAWVAGFSSVTPISTISNTSGPPITVISGSFDIAITPNSKTLYVTNDVSQFGYGMVTPVNASTDKALRPIKVGSEPMAIAITPH